MTFNLNVLTTDKELVPCETLCRRIVFEPANAEATKLLTQYVKQATPITTIYRAWELYQMLCSYAGKSYSFPNHQLFSDLAEGVYKQASLNQLTEEQLAEGYRALLERGKERDQYIQHLKATAKSSKACPKDREDAKEILARSIF